MGFGEWVSDTVRIMATLPVVPLTFSAGGSGSGTGSGPGEPPPLSEADRRRISAELASAVEGEVRFGLHDRMLYSTDASLYQVEPLGVVIPSSVDDAVRAVEFCVRHGLPILPRGGGTSLAGQCVNRAVVIDFSPRCRGVRWVDVAGRRAMVEPGVPIDDLNEELARRGTGLFFAPDPATTRQCNIGGCIGNNAAGARSIMYGRTSENVLGIDALVLTRGGARRVMLEKGAARRDPLVRDLSLAVARVVTAHAGLIRERFPRTVRRNAGYGLDMILAQMDSAGARADADEILSAMNLAPLLCGSEGTLAVTLGADLLLRPVPRAKGLAVVGFDSLEAAIEAVVPILGLGPSAVEMLDDTVIDLALMNAEYRRYVELMPAPEGGALRATLYVEFFAFEAGEGEAARAIEGKFAALRAMLPRLSPTARMSVYTSGKEMLQAWKLRKAGEPLLHGLPGERKPITFVEDNAVPVERLGEFVREFRGIVERHGTRAAFWAHASVGVLHVRPLLSLRDEADRVRMGEIAVEVADLARRLGGVMSGEHGDGRVRGPLLERFYGPELMGAFRQIKAIFDPLDLLNPGNIVRPGDLGSIAERIRVRPLGRDVDVPSVETYYSYEDQHGFRGAVEMCNGAGVCRKTTGGTMCPSYMGTLDERHSTRGRGNALRLAITGQFGVGGEALWSDAETMETLELCLSCKACKSECPSNVDIARLKAEYTAQRYRAEGRVPLRARVFGNVRVLNRLGSLTPGLANWMNRQPLARAIAGRVLGLARERTIPLFDRPLSRQWRVEGELESRVPAGSPRVALYVDCFTGFNDPRIGLAARRVLERFGYEVVLADAGCCGRAQISTGLLEGAIASADRTLERLLPLAEDPSVRAVLVCEPSCLSAITDDWVQLKLRTPIDRRRALAKKSMLVEDFLHQEWSSHPARPEVDAADLPERVVFHGHCHQKALYGAESGAGLLRRVVGDRLVVLDAGCCGMAGSFGYSSEKYELSMRIGELVLLPAVRSAGRGAAIVAAGTSCRHQIHDGASIHAEHPVELLDRLLSASEARRCGAVRPVEASAAGLRVDRAAGR